MKKRSILLILKLLIFVRVLFNEVKIKISPLFFAQSIKNLADIVKNIFFHWINIESRIVDGMETRITLYFTRDIRQKLIKNIPVLSLPLLFGLFPLFFLFAQNAKEMMIQNLLSPVLSVILFSVSITFILGFAIKNFRKSSLATALLLFSFFSYGHIIRILPALRIRLGNTDMGTGQIFIIPFLVLLIFLVIRIFRARLNLFPLMKILASVGTMLLVFQVVQAGFILATRKNIQAPQEFAGRVESAQKKQTGKNSAGNASDKKNTALKASASKKEGADKEQQKKDANKVVASKKKNTGKIYPDADMPYPVQESDAHFPDIYYIVVDAYGRSDILKEIYGVDNSWFIDFLKEKGFHVPEKACSHYCQTIFSLSAVLNMNYVNSFGEFDPSMTDRIPVAVKLRKNRVMSLLKKAGYATVAFATGYENTDISSADVFIKPSGTMSEFENVLMTTTMLPASQTEGDSQFAAHRRRINFILNKIPEITETEKPRFVFAHIVCPHPPFVFGKNGEPVQQGEIFHMGDGSHFTNYDKIIVRNYISGYADQITYLTGQLKLMIGKLLDRYADNNKPIIILQADHGPGSGLDWTSIERTNIKERHSILHAYYLPGYAGQPAYDDIMPINIFRAILNTYFNAKNEMLPSRSYFTLWGAPYNFMDVTERLIKENSNEPQISSNQ